MHHRIHRKPSISLRYIEATIGLFDDQGRIRSRVTEMIEADTTILVRYLVKDDPQQTREATDFLAKNQCMVLQTVLQQTVWGLG